MIFYVPYKKEIFSNKFIKCPICGGKKDLVDPFTGESYPCPGIVVRRNTRYQCINGKISPMISTYKYKKYTLDGFTVKYPEEVLSSVVLAQYSEDWPDEPSSRVYYSHDLIEKHFFKTEEEAQDYCDKMNKKTEEQE